MKACTVVACLMVVCWCPPLRAAAPDPQADRFFGLTNLWTIHLTVSAEDWKALEPPLPERRGPPPFGPRPPMAPAPPPGEDPLPPSLGEPPGPRPEPFAPPGVGLRPPGDDLPRGPRPGPFHLEFPWATCTFECAGQTLTNVGLRFKGNSSFNMSRGTLKRPFRLDFERQVKGREFGGIQELCLNNNFNDPTQMREVLAYDLFRRAGLPASRTAYAKVWLTVPGQFERRYLGLYTVVEPVEGGFLKRHFGSKKGLLTKPEGLRGIEYLGNDWPPYAGRYEPKTKVRDADARRLIAFARFIEEADDVTFAAKLGNYASPETLLRFIALNALLANMDSFLGNGHNYYLYVHPQTGLAHFVAWDLNEAFGRHPMAGPPSAQMSFSIRRPQGFPNRLIERVLADPKLDEAYLAQCSELLTNLFDTAQLHARIEAITQVTRTAIAEESPRAQAAFERTALGLTNTPLPALRPPPPGADSPSAIEPLAARPPRDSRGLALNDTPLKEWITGRVTSVTDQLAGKSEGTLPRYTRPGGAEGPRWPGRQPLPRSP